MSSRHDVEPGQPCSETDWPPPTLPRDPLAETLPNAGPAGESVGDYVLQEPLGQGGMGIVYRALDVKLKRAVALKVLHGRSDASPEELLRFRAEAELLASLEHPHIVHVFDFGMYRGQPYLVMELVEGGSLAGHTDGHPQPPRDAATRIETIARAVHFAHERGIIHRDLKPANILLTPGGTPKITDFGLAKRLEGSLHLTRSGAVMGTPEYMAPEQASEGKTVGVAADVYGLGAIFYELLTGRPPFRGIDWMDTLEQVRLAEPASPSRLVASTPRDLSTICLKCLEKDPARRYASAADLADDLRRWLDGEAIRARPTSTIERFWRAVRRHPLRAALAACSGMLLVLLTLVAWLESRRRQERIIFDQAQRIIRIEQEKEQLARQFLDAEHNRSLEALDGILDLVLRGPLRNRPGLEPLHQELLRYYDRLVTRQESNALAPRDRLAAACFRLGQLIRATGRKTDALAALDKAQQLYDRLVTDAARSNQARHHLALALLERGMLHRDLGQLLRSEDDLKAARAHLERLQETGRTQPAAQPRIDIQRDLAEVFHNLGILLAEVTERRSEAEGHYRRALELRQELCARAEATLDDRRNLARSHGFLGDLELELGKFAQADRSYRASHRLRERLAVEERLDPDEAQFQLARSWGNFAGYQSAVHALATAIAFHEKAHEIQKELVRRQPAVTDYQADLGNTLNRMAELKLLLGDADLATEALADLRAALTIHEQLWRVNAQAVRVPAGLAETHTLLARCLLTQDARQVRHSLAQARKLYEELRQRRRRPDELYQLAAVRSLQAEQAQGDERLAGFRDSLDLLRQAMQMGFRRLHPDEIRRDRAFRAVAGEQGEALARALALADPTSGR